MFLVVARLIGPLEYGLAAQAFVYQGLTTLLVDQGLAAAIVQRRVLDLVTLRRIARQSLIVTMVIAVATTVLAPSLSAYYSTPEATGMYYVLSLDVFLKSFIVLRTGLALRHLRFAYVALSEVAAAVVACTASILHAAVAPSFWSVITFMLVQDMVLVSVLLGGTPWRPDMTSGPPPSEVRLNRYGLNLLGSQLLNFSGRNADTVLVGRLLGPAALGVYDFSYRLMLQPLNGVTQVVNRVAFPMYSRLWRQGLPLDGAFITAIRGVALATWPAMATLGTAGSLFIEPIFGVQWEEAVPVLWWLSAAGAFQCVNSLPGPIFMSSGRTDWQFRLVAVQTLITVSVFGVVVRHGVVVLAAALAAVSFLLFPFAFVVVGRLIAVRLSTVLRELVPGLVAACAIVGCYGAAVLAPKTYEAAVYVLSAACVWCVVAVLLLRVWRRTRQPTG